MERDRPTKRQPPRLPGTPGLDSPHRVYAVVYTGRVDRWWHRLRAWLRRVRAGLQRWWRRMMRRKE